MWRMVADAKVVPFDDLAPKVRHVSRKLETELRECGLAMDAKMFRELVSSRHVETHPSWTEDELTCHPDAAKAFCNAIRNEVQAPVPDHVILRTLLNVRKSG